MTPQDKFADDLEPILESIKHERIDLMNGSNTHETRELIRNGLRYLANEAKKWTG